MSAKTCFEGGVKGLVVMGRVRGRTWRMHCVCEGLDKGRSVSGLVSSEADVVHID